jgi:hypothetical protein
MYTIMSTILPQEVNYSLMGAVPNGTSSMDVNVAPSNGASFALSSGSIITFDLPSIEGFMVPDSLCLRYKYTLSGASESKIRATPGYAPFARLETVIGGQVAETIPDYNKIMDMYTNCTMNVAQKYSNIGYGWRIDNDSASLNLEALDGHHAELNESGSFSVPLVSLLSSCEKYVPLGAMGFGSRINLTLDSLSNVFCPAAGVVVADPINGILASAAIAVPTDMVLSDLILSFNVVKFAADATNQILGSGPIIIKSQTFNATSQAIPIGTSGVQELVYGQKMASMKSAFMHFSSNSINGKFDSFDILGTNNGDVQFSIGSRMYPARPLSNSIGNRAMIFTSLKSAMGSIYDKNNSLSINNTEFYKSLGTASTCYSPAKFYVGINTQVVPSNTVLLSGLNTESTTVNVRMNISSATVAAVNATLITACDVLLEIDPETRSVVVRK